MDRAIEGAPEPTRPPDDRYGLTKSTVDTGPTRDTTKASRPPAEAAGLFDPERIRETQRVWSRAYGRVVTEQEAVEILLSVRLYVKALATKVREGRA